MAKIYLKRVPNKCNGSCFSKDGIVCYFFNHTGCAIYSNNCAKSVYIEVKRGD